ncbi:MAG: hypothetical protein Q605_AUC00157G0001, partial [Actinomyces urogenitalis DORA_12]
SDGVGSKKEPGRRLLRAGGQEDCPGCLDGVAALGFQTSRNQFIDAACNGGQLVGIADAGVEWISILPCLFQGCPEYWDLRPAWRPETWC